MKRTQASRWPAAIVAAALVLGSSHRASAQQAFASYDRLDPDPAVLRRDALEAMRSIGGQGGPVGDIRLLRIGIDLAESLLGPPPPGAPSWRSASAPDDPAPAPASLEAWLTTRQ